MYIRLGLEWKGQTGPSVSVGGVHVRSKAHERGQTR